MSWSQYSFAPELSRCVQDCLRFGLEPAESAANGSVVREPLAQLRFDSRGPIVFFEVEPMRDFARQFEVVEVSPFPAHLDRMLDLL